MPSHPSRSPARSFHYRAHGLALRSQLPLPGFTAARGSRYDVEIRAGPVPSHLSGAPEVGLRYESAPGEFLLRVDGVARLLVSGGERIVIAPSPHHDTRILTEIIQGPAMAALLAQRGTLALKASAVAVRGEAVLFAGFSGAGKSTLAAALAARGHAVLGDDPCSLRRTDGRWFVEPGRALFRLWPDMLAALKLSAAGPIPDPWTDSRREVAPPFATQLQPLPVRQIYFVVPGLVAQPEIHALDAIEALDSLEETCLYPGLRGLGQLDKFRDLLLHLADTSPIKRLDRPRSETPPLPLVRLIEEDLAS